MRHEVVIVRTPKGHMVVPGYVVVSYGDEIAWRNQTRQPIQVLLPRGTPGLASFAEEHDSGNASLRIPAEARAGFYPYSVFSAEANDFCLGNSTPGVIIKG